MYKLLIFEDIQNVSRVYAKKIQESLLDTSEYQLWMLTRIKFKV